MAQEDKINKIEEVTKDKSSAASVSEAQEDIVERTAPNKDLFDSLVDQQQKETPRGRSIQTVEGSTTSSLMDEVRNLNTKVDGIAKASPKELIDQAKGVIAQIDGVKEKLASPNLELKSSVQSLLKSKLTHIDESLKVAMNRAGLEYTPEMNATKSLSNPIEQFMGYLTHGQYQLNRLANDVQFMGSSKNFTPADMLAIQIKVGFVQNELEFFSNLLNKALESTKTIMNVQV